MSRHSSDVYASPFGPERGHDRVDARRSSVGQASPEAARLFGSRARGQADAASDVDIAVVLERAGWDEHRTVTDIAADVGLAFDLDISPTIGAARELLENVQQRIATGLESNPP